MLKDPERLEWSGLKPNERWEKAQMQTIGAALVPKSQLDKQGWEFGDKAVEACGLAWQLCVEDRGF